MITADTYSCAQRAVKVLSVPLTSARWKLAIADSDSRVGAEVGVDVIDAGVVLGDQHEHVDAPFDHRAQAADDVVGRRRPAGGVAELAAQQRPLTARLARCTTMSLTLGATIRTARATSTSPRSSFIQELAR